MEKTLIVTNDAGREFTVRLLKQGDKYGRDNCMTWGTTDFERAWGDAVEFYDRTNMFTEHGQFVSRYYVRTILEDIDEKHGIHGLNLDGGISVWKIDAEAMEDVYDWILHHHAMGRIEYVYI